MESPEPQCGKFIWKLQQAGIRSKNLIHSINKHLPRNKHKGQDQHKVPKEHTCEPETNLTEGTKIKILVSITLA